LVTVPGATANSTATNSGSRIVSRRSFNASSSAMATDAPIQALRPSVSARATTSAGITSAGQVRACRPKMRRAAAAQMTSISSPE
jgi:hypothetical protein